MIFNRVWAMPNADTFSIPDIGAFVKRYLHSSEVSVDPFARNNRWATHTNDLNPNTQAQHHMEAREFLKNMIPDASCDLAIFDPPYSPRQISEVYESIGKKCGMKDTQSAVLYSEARDLLLPLLTSEAVVLSFGWNSVGMGKGRGFEIFEILLVCHGGGHNDTICLAEKRMPDMQGNLF